MKSPGQAEPVEALECEYREAGRCLLRPNGRYEPIEGGQHFTFKFSADDLPLLETNSNSTVCPSLRLLSPARSAAEMITKTSWPAP